MNGNTVRSLFNAGIAAVGWIGAVLIWTAAGDWRVGVGAFLLAFYAKLTFREEQGKMN